MEPWKALEAKYAPPKPGEPELHCAARTGDTTTIRRLAADGADLNALFDIALDPEDTPCPATPLMVAAGSGDGATLDTVKLLIELGADPRLTVEMQSAADFACSGLSWNYKPGGDGARLQHLLDAGSPLPADPKEANRLLCKVAAAGDPQRVRILLARGISARGYFDPEEALRHHRAVMQYVADRRKDRPDPLASMPEEFRARMAEQERLEAIKNEERYVSAPSSADIPLFRAAESGSAECLRLLLDAGADAKARDSSQSTAMYHISSVDCARELLRAGLPLEDADVYDCTPLGSAVSAGSLALPRARALIQIGANVNASHDRGYSVFMSAVGSHRGGDLLEVLVAAGADPLAVSELGYNALHALVESGNGPDAEASLREKIQYLKSLGVNLEHRNNRGLTPLALAVQSGNAVEVRSFCELGADPNAICPLLRFYRQGCEWLDLPLLFHAALGSRSDEEVAKTEALLKAGANSLAEDANGSTALMLVVASLCEEAADSSASYRSFYLGLNELCAEGPPAPRSQDSFMSQAFPILSAYIERFAAAIPITSQSEFAGESRRAEVGVITQLCTYEGWARQVTLLTPDP